MQLFSVQPSKFPHSESLRTHIFPRGSCSLLHPKNSICSRIRISCWTLCSTNLERDRTTACRQRFPLRTGLRVARRPAPLGWPPLDPPDLGPAQRPADRRKRVSGGGAPLIVARAVRPRIAKPVALAPSTALRALAAHVRSTATTPEDIFVQSAAVCLEGNACDRDTRVASAAC